MIIYDVHYPSWAKTDQQAILRWLRENGIEPKYIYRIEVDRRRIAVVYEYQTDPDGRVLVDRQKKEPIYKTPYQVRLVTRPPLGQREAAAIKRG